MKYCILVILALAIVGCESEDDRANARPQALPSVASVHELNREYFEERKLLRELDEVVENLAPGADAAMRDAARIRSDPASAGARRERLLDQLDYSYEAYKKQMQHMQERWAAYDESLKTSNNSEPELEERIRDLRVQVEIKKQLDHITNLRASLLKSIVGYAPDKNNHRPVHQFQIGE
jgi:chromosome segregation ATPase